MDLVYGEIDDGLVFIERRIARELVTIREANGTWAELKAALPEVRWAEIVDRMTDGGAEPMVDLETQVALDAIRGFSDTAWPEWSAQAMLTWMPHDIVSRFGSINDSVHDGSFLVLDSGYEEAIVEALEELGWSCEEDDGLVMTASGYDW